MPDLSFVTKVVPAVVVVIVLVAIILPQAIRILREQPCGPRLRLFRPDLEAFVKSLWLLGVWHPGRLAYWRLLVTALLRRPRQFPKAMELAIIGHHFRRVASDL